MQVSSFMPPSNFHKKFAEINDATINIHIKVIASFKVEEC